MTSTRIDQVVPASAAAKAGFQKGDIVLSANGRRLESSRTCSFTCNTGPAFPSTSPFAGAAKGSSLARPASIEEKSPFGA